MTQPTEAVILSDAVVRETYNQMHETALEMGFPSILEALEALARRIEAEGAPQPDARDARIAELEAALREAVEWDSHDSEGVPAVWLERAEALLAAIEKARTYNG